MVYFNQEKYIIFLNFLARTLQNVQKVPHIHLWRIWTRIYQIQSYVNLIALIKFDTNRRTLRSSLYLLCDLKICYVQFSLYFSSFLKCVDLWNGRQGKKNYLINLRYTFVIYYQMTNKTFERGNPLQSFGLFP